MAGVARENHAERRAPESSGIFDGRVRSYVGGSGSWTQRPKSTVGTGRPVVRIQQFADVAIWLPKANAMCLDMGRTRRDRLEIV